jgi:hypothetical protein
VVDGELEPPPQSLLGTKTITAATMNTRRASNLDLGSSQITLSSAPNVIRTGGTIADTVSLITLAGADGNLTWTTRTPSATSKFSRTPS